MVIKKISFESRPNLPPKYDRNNYRQSKSQKFLKIKLLSLSALAK